DAYPTSQGWQREECKINLYLFACAVACTTDDYLNLRFVNFSGLLSRSPSFWPLLRLLEWVINTPLMLLRMVINSPAWLWRRRWNGYIEECCNVLWTDAGLKITSSKLPDAPLSKHLQNWKMRLPEAFRGQDFTHHDIISLVDRFCKSSEYTDRTIGI